MTRLEYFKLDKCELGNMYNRIGVCYRKLRVDDEGVYRNLRRERRLSRIDSYVMDAMHGKGYLYWKFCKDEECNSKVVFGDRTYIEGECYRIRRLRRTWKKLRAEYK